MATGLVSGEVADARPRPYRLTVKQFLDMIGAAVFAKGPRVELLGGVLYEKVVKHPPHDFGVSATADRLRALLPPGWCLREEKPVEIDAHSRPEPDVAVLRGRLDAYRYNDPQPGDIGLIIEVADSSHAEDRGEKYFRYASAKVPSFAILNIRDRRLELYRKPHGRGGAARYREASVFDESAEFR
jgi:Uma2 family endonuclease